MKFVYSLAFLLGADNWKIDPTPEELMETVKSLPQKETTILDLGCGDGHDCLTIAKAGYRTIGVDFVPLAIRKAKKAAETAGVGEQISFYQGDVGNLDRLDLPKVDLAYDIGCFHLLEADKAQDYIEGLAALLKKDGIFILKAFAPRQQGKKTVGYAPHEIETIFATLFKVEKTSDHSYWRYPATWYWMRRI